MVLVQSLDKHNPTLRVLDQTLRVQLESLDLLESLVGLIGFFDAGPYSPLQEIDALQLLLQSSEEGQNHLGLWSLRTLVDVHEYRSSERYLKTRSVR